MPTVKYFNPGTSTWEEVSTAGAQGPPGPAGPTGPEGQGGGVSVDAGNIATLGSDTKVFVPDQVVVGLVAPTNVDPLTAPLWVDEGATSPSGGFDQATGDLLYVNVTGDTMTGPLNLAADPVAADPPLQAATKQYVDDLITVSTSDPDPVNDIPARDGLQWIVVEP